LVRSVRPSAPQNNYFEEASLLPFSCFFFCHLQPCSSCCQTNRTQAWRRLLSQSLRNTTWAYGTTFNFSLKLPLVAADDDARGWRTRDVEWLYSLVTRQLELDASWFVLDTPYPLNMSDNTTFVADVANTRVGVSLPLNVNSHWYFN
jgi:hypothetical protein